MNGDEENLTSGQLFDLTTGLRDELAAKIAAF